jgi:phosphoglycolate phosphatase-like HAD superfamily hydrolase
MGMLLALIDGHTLYDAMEGAPIATKKRLMDQVDATVNKLHGHGLVWAMLSRKTSWSVLLEMPF